MDGIVFSGVKVLGALLLVGLNGLFVAAEFSLVKVRATQVESLVREGRTSAGLVKEATEKLDTYLAVTQLGITLASLGLGALGEPAVASLIRPLLDSLLPESALHVVAFAISFGIITFLHVVFGELAPKTLAIQKAESTSLFVAPIMKFFYYPFLPGVKLFNGAANTFTRLLGLPPASESEETHTEEELRSLIAQSTRQGVLEGDEESRLEAVFDLEDTLARKIMVPRPDVVALPADTPLDKLFSFAATGNHTRYPIHESGRVGRIIGSVHVKDVMGAVEEKGSREADVAAQDIMREIMTVPENRLIDDILTDFQKRKIQMAVVVDEWGSFEGLITIEDILEEIVGDIRDEFDEEEPAIRKLENDTYCIGGRTPIHYVNEALGSGFESEDFETVSGLILDQLGRIPEAGDEVQIDGYTLRVDEVDGPSVARVTAARA